MLPAVELQQSWNLRRKKPPKMMVFIWKNKPLYTHRFYPFKLRWWPLPVANLATASAAAQRSSAPGSAELSAARWLLASLSKVGWWQASWNIFVHVWNHPKRWESKTCWKPPTRRMSLKWIFFFNVQLILNQKHTLRVTRLDFRGFHFPWNQTPTQRSKQHLVQLSEFLLASRPDLCENGAKDFRKRLLYNIKEASVSMKWKNTEVKL